MALEKLLEFYKEEVKEKNKKGFSKIFKNATFFLFEKINEKLKCNLHFEDVKFLDGYFIFGKGTNSVVHFLIKEMPGWLGGIWWKPVEKENKKDVYDKSELECDVFFQYEEEIDKFKPSASTFNVNFHLKLGKKFYGTFDCGFIHCCDMIKFITDEPYLAFYREMTNTNFNEEHITRNTAKKYYVKYLKKKKERLQNNIKNTKLMFNTYKSIIHTEVEKGNAFIYDRDILHPRYEIALKGRVEETKGYADILDVFPDAEKIYNETYNKCEKGKFYFDNEFSGLCDIIDTKRFNKLFNSAIKENRLVYGKLKDGKIIDNLKTIINNLKGEN